MFFLWGTGSLPLLHHICMFRQSTYILHHTIGLFNKRVQSRSLDMLKHNIFFVGTGDEIVAPMTIYFFQNNSSTWKCMKITLAGQLFEWFGTQQANKLWVFQKQSIYIPDVSPNNLREILLVEFVTNIFQQILALHVAGYSDSVYFSELWKFLNSVSILWETVSVETNGL